MSRSGEWRFEEVARKARRVQDAVARVRGTASGEGVRVEVAADGRITRLHLADSALAQAISSAHAEALERATASAVALRRESLEDDTVVRGLRRLLETEPSDSAAAWEVSARFPASTPTAASYGTSVAAEENPYALPVAVRRRYGLA
ncbi:YbaB/EbfC family nucleoid-associated protein [Nocardia sp. NBC_01503]|uniref:YbaB/EbfC family nucleoid-associated protein n=1 Tax=Nocardia sp. NBC_01503 TaxID=2975997 RepID=UPI002E7B662C|nr:YbaB/EbfC family nucleoid-associated protein [Nocardia sp. NBC_01503]WTL34273.1 YbaB/EbfC family nucleoid-associated protein [Nocardia sp. NBC_01503]